MDVMCSLMAKPELPELVQESQEFDEYIMDKLAGEINLLVGALITTSVCCWEANLMFGKIAGKGCYMSFITLYVPYIQEF